MLGAHLERETDRHATEVAKKIVKSEDGIKKRRMGGKLDK